MDHFRKATSPLHFHRMHGNLPGLTTEATMGLKSTYSLPNLDLSLRLDGPHARDSSSLHQSTSFGNNTEKAGHFKLEQVNPWMRLPSTSVMVKEEPASSPPSWEPPSAVCDLSPLVFRTISSDIEEGTETSSISTLDLLHGKHGMGPFSTNGGVLQEPMPSSENQLAGACTIDKVKMALQRTQYDTSVKISASAKSGTAGGNLLQPSIVGTKRKLPCSPLLQAQSTKKTSSAAAASGSPTSSDASSSLSCKSSLHSSGSGGHGSFPDAKAKVRSDMPPAGSIDAKVDDRVGCVTLVVVACTSCHMFHMQSKGILSCARCGGTLLEVPPPRKRRREGDAVPP